MIVYCTLFDSNYLTRGLALYDSLRASGDKFLLYVLCLDNLTLNILQKLELPGMILVPLDEFEDDSLRKVKHDRTRAEYCWTCTPHLINYCLERFVHTQITYVDADLFFFKTPSIIFDEFSLSDASVLITEHRYTPKYDQSARSGIYCVQLLTFKTDTKGLTVLQWWKERCLEWCYARFENGKFGDQKYLDDWPQRFSGVHVLRNIGGGVAPWNVQQYQVTEGPRVNGIPVVFYHFHHLRWFEDDRIDLGIYRIPEETIRFIYEPYFQNLIRQNTLIRAIEPNFNKGNDPYNKRWNALRNLKRIIMGRYNVIRR